MECHRVWKNHVFRVNAIPLVRLVRVQLLAVHVPVNLALLEENVPSVLLDTVDPIAHNVLVTLAEQCPVENVKHIVSARFVYIKVFAWN